MSSMNSFPHNKIAILGFGIEGKSSACFLLDQGAFITIIDEKEQSSFNSAEIREFKEMGVEFIFGALPDLTTFDLIVRSPGISLKKPELQAVVAKVTSATKLFFDLCPCPIIGVTGTKGKGTTSSLIYEMLKKDGRDAYLGGNIGVPALDFLKDLSKDSIVVLELSSFQLVDLHKSPHIAVLLMITSEHLDYHKDVYEYVDAKRNLLRFQTPSDYAIINKDYPASNESDIHTEAQIYAVSRERGLTNGCFVQDGKVIVKTSKEEVTIVETKDILLPGAHNWENVCAASMAAVLAGVSSKSISSVLKTFNGLEHRLELVRTVNGVRFYDDSFSTTPETAEAAILAFEEPEILILGGSSKNSDFVRLGKVISEAKNIKAIIGVGVEWTRIKDQIFNKDIPVYEGSKTMAEVVKKAAELAEFGDVALLSPACASFDMFKNYKERGDQFKAEVAKL